MDLPGRRSLLPGQPARAAARMLGAVLLPLLLLARPGNASGQAPFQAAPVVSTVAVEIEGSTVFVPATVNDSSLLWFILDTGANSCVLDDSVPRRLRLTPRAEGAGTGAGAGTFAYRKYRREDVQFRVGPARFRCEHVISLDLSGQPAILGRRVDGILGSDFIAQYVVELDYEAAILRLHRPDSFEYSGSGEAIPLTFERRLPYVSALLTVPGSAPAQRRLLLDSGSEDAVDDDLLLQSSGPLRETLGGVGLGQPYRVVFGRLERVRLGRFEFRDVPSVAPGISLLGGEILRRFVVLLDYARSRMILEPNSHLQDGFAAGESGLDLRSAEAGSLLRVAEVRAGSAAGVAGLRPGDAVTMLDGVPVAKLGLRRVQALLKRTGTVFSLRVRRGARTFDVQVRTGPDANPGQDPR